MFPVCIDRQRKIGAARHASFGHLVEGDGAGKGGFAGPGTSREKQRWQTVYAAASASFRDR
jgi:hypothetical protein